MINRSLFQLTFDLFPAIFEAPGHDMTPLEHIPRPWIAGIAIWTSKLAFGMIEVLVQNVAQDQCKA